MTNSSDQLFPVLDITDTPNVWTKGDRAEFTHKGTGMRCVLPITPGGWIAYVGDPADNEFILDLRVTRPTPVLPDHDGAVIQWKTQLGTPYTAELVLKTWTIAGEEQEYTSEQLLRRIKGAQIMVATFAPLMTGSKSPTS